MKIKLTWQEFVDAALRDLNRRHHVLGLPEFYQQNSYEADSTCYTFPPAYVELEVGAGRMEEVEIGL